MIVEEINRILGERLARGCKAEQIGENPSVTAKPMKIATYNVNGVNGRLPVLLRWLKEVQPDIICLQELKATLFADLAWIRPRSSQRRPCRGVSRSASTKMVATILISVSPRA